jgi:murein DD-endopeptidase MepM/ murein hydrolase activator NlpD
MLVLPVNNYFKFQRGFRHLKPYPASLGSLAGKPHLGVDILCDKEQLFAPMAGTIEQSVGKEGGNTIILTSGELTFRFLHLSEFIGKPRKVAAGELIGITGNTGVSTRPHLHLDGWWGEIELNNPYKTIDLDQFFSFATPSLVVVSENGCDVDSIKNDCLKMGIHINISQLTLPSSKPVWLKSSAENAEIDPVWWDTFITTQTQGFDIVAVITKDFHRLGANGYAKRSQYHGQWRCVVKDSGKHRQYGQSLWNGVKQIEGTTKHEISHVLSMSTGKQDTTHDLDFSGKSLDQRWNMGKFKGV